MVWVIMRRRGVSSERRRSSCSSFIWSCSNETWHLWVWFHSCCMPRLGWYHHAILRSEVNIANAHYGYNNLSFMFRSMHHLSDLIELIDPKPVIILSFHSLQLYLSVWILLTKGPWNTYLIMWYLCIDGFK